MSKEIKYGRATHRYIIKVLDAHKSAVCNMLFTYLNFKGNSILYVSYLKFNLKVFLMNFIIFKCPKTVSKYIVLYSTKNEIVDFRLNSSKSSESQVKQKLQSDFQHQYLSKS